MMTGLARFLCCLELSLLALNLQLRDAAAAEPHPAVARIIVPERDGTAFGSGTLIDVREQYGLVLTNWHVVRDATGPIEVLFPGGFHSLARAIKLDSDWDLAALVVWRPATTPVRMASRPPAPGDRLTIAGYGRGDYRQVSGTCTQFYSPRLDLPRELVELDVQARQGDSGGPIFNEQGELAGVLFGAGQGTTVGSFEGRVKTFLASLAPNIGESTDEAPQVQVAAAQPSVDTQPAHEVAQQPAARARLLASRPAGNLNARDQFAEIAAPPATASDSALVAEPTASRPPDSFLPSTTAAWNTLRNTLACIGAISLLVQFVRWAG